MTEPGIATADSETLNTQGKSFSANEATAFWSVSDQIIRKPSGETGLTLVLDGGVDNISRASAPGVYDSCRQQP
jgi:hypothetical protein